jgi:hypothetical protein
MLTSQRSLIEVGRLTVDPHKYDATLDAMITKTLEKLDHCKAGERSYFGSKLKDLRTLKSARIMSQRECVRMKPYGILLHGGTSVGKSAVSNALVQYILKVNNFASDPKNIITLNEFDKFQSEYRTYHSGVIFDDLANAKKDTVEGNPLMKIIQFINNAPMAALNPNVELKGNVMIEPSVVLGTTNVKEISAGDYSNEPLSILRRFNCVITMRVRPEYCIEGTKMLDPEKLNKAFPGQIFPDYAYYTIERAILKPGATCDHTSQQAIKFVPHKFEGKELVDVDIKTALRFMKEQSFQHFQDQRDYVKKFKANQNLELDEDGMPMEFDSQYCDVPALESDYDWDDDEELESQFFSLPSFAPIFECEEQICSWVENKIRLFFYSRWGRMLLIALNRDLLLDIWHKTIYIACVSVVMAIIAEIYNYKVMLPTLIFSIIYSIVIVGYLYWKRRNDILRFSTLPRPSRYIRRMSHIQKMKLISTLGGMAFINLLRKVIKKWKTIPTSHGLPPKLEVTDDKEVKPWWGSETRREKEQSYVVPVDTPHTTKCMKSHELLNSMKRRQYMLYIGEEGSSAFCNAVPIRSSILLIPNHVVPKKTTQARLLKEGSNTKHVFIQPESTYRIPNTDYALWYLPEMGDQKDITAYFLNEMPRGKKILSTMLYNDCGKLKIFNPMMCTRDYKMTSKGGSFEALTYSFPGETFNGLCMATLLAENNKGAVCIPGFHLAGKGSFGCAGFITRQQLIDGCAQLNSIPGVLASHSAVDFPEKIADVNVKITPPHEKFLSYLPTYSKCRIFGAHSFPRAKAKSKVIISDISEIVTKVMKLPRLHDKPKDMASTRHIEVDIADKVNTAYKFRGDSVLKAIQDYQTTISERMTDKMYAALGVLPLDAILAGVDGVQGINAMAFNTSAGFPLVGTKERYTALSDRYVEGISCPRDVDPLIVEEMERMEEILARGDRVNMVFKGALKDEPTKMTKDKVRVFAGCNMAATMLVRKYFLTISALMQVNKELFECAVAINPCSPEWTKMMKHIYRFGENRVIAGDYKSFDRRMSPRFMLAAFDILIDLAKESGQYDDRDIMIMKGLATEICNPTYDHFGTLVQFFGSNPSGHPLTVVINSVVNSLYMRYCYYEIARQDKWWRVPRFNKVVSLMTYGDDNIMSVKEGFDSYNHTRIAEVFDAAGITYTMADKEAESVPFIDGRDAGFLKRDAIWDTELQLYRARLDEQSISKSLHTHLESSAITEQQHCAEAIIGAADEYFEYGREVYDEKRTQLMEVSEEAGLTGLVGVLKTYDEQLERFCERHAWEIAPVV